MNKRFNKTIPIVFSSNNDDYAYYCYVSIFSLLEKADRNNFYEIYILQTEDSRQGEEIFSSLNRRYARVTCVDISKFSDQYYMKGELHVSTETYFRFFIPLVVKGYRKAIYLDSKLYDIDLDGFVIGAAQDTDCNFIEEHCNKIGIDNYKEAFNAGVLLIDCEAFEKQRIREKCLSILEEDNRRKERKYYYLDQDALNIVIQNNYKKIDRRWNVQYQYTWRMETLKSEFKNIYHNLLETAFILHYAGDRKPWEYPTYQYAGEFWQYAKQTSVFYNIIENLMKRYRTATRYLMGFERYTFPYKLIPYNATIIVYGAGILGTSYYEQAKVSQYANVLYMVDKDWEKLDKTLNVRSVESIKKDNFDYILIGIMKGTIAYEVKNTLLSIGVEESKIVWDDSYDI